VGCDVTAQPAAPDAGATSGASSSIGARAMVDVIGRGGITGPRLTAWRAFANGSDLRAREAAVELLGAHHECAGGAAAPVGTFCARELGLGGTAAEVIAKHPERAVDDAPHPSSKKTKRKKRRDKDRDNDKDDKPTDSPVGTASPAVTAALIAALGL